MAHFAYCRHCFFFSTHLYCADHCAFFIFSACRNVLGGWLRWALLLLVIFFCLFFQPRGFVEILVSSLDFLRACYQFFLGQLDFAAVDLDPELLRCGNGRVVSRLLADGLLLAVGLLHHELLSGAVVVDVGKLVGPQVVVGVIDTLKHRHAGVIARADPRFAISGVVVG